MDRREEQLEKVRALIEQAIAICEKLGAPLAANYMHLGLAQLEEAILPNRVHELPTDLPRLD